MTDRIAPSIIKGNLPHHCDINVSHVSAVDIDEMVTWCIAELGKPLLDRGTHGFWDRWYSDNVLTFYFKNEADAVMFKLRFGGSC